MTTGHGGEAIDWERLPGCGVHGGRRCFPSESFARLAAESYTVTFCWHRASWHIAPKTPDPFGVIPRQRTAA